MKVILQEDVRNLGKVGDVLKVSDGYARNFLIPRKLAVIATEKNEKEFVHLKLVADKKKAKALDAKKAIAKTLQGLTVSFKAKAGDTDKLFGAITNGDISEELAKQGHVIDRHDIVLTEPIKILGQHRAIIKLGAGLEADIKVSVERA